MIGTARNHAKLTLSKLDISPAAKEPDLSSTLVIFKLKALCCLISLWTLHSNDRGHILKMAARSIQAAESSTFESSRVAELSVYSLSNNTHVDTQRPMRLQESFLSLSSEAKDHRNDSKQKPQLNVA